MSCKIWKFPDLATHHSLTRCSNSQQITHQLAGPILAKPQFNHAIKYQINTSRLFSYTRLIQVPGCTVTRSADHLSCFHARKKTWPPNSFDSSEPVPEAKDFVVTLEKRTISYLSVSARIRVIDPFSQMKREYNTILDDADSANRNNFVPSQSFT